MTTQTEALRMALEFIESVHQGEWSGSVSRHQAKEAIKEALAQPEQEPITKLFGTLPIYDEHEFRKGFIAGQRDAFNRLEEQPEQEPVATVGDLVPSRRWNLKLPEDAKLYTAPPQRTWVGLMRGVRVDGDTVVISTNNNDAARELCGSLIEEMNT